MDATLTILQVELHRCPNIADQAPYSCCDWAVRAIQTQKGDGKGEKQGNGVGVDLLGHVGAVALCLTGLQVGVHKGQHDAGSDGAVGNEQLQARVARHVGARGIAADGVSEGRHCLCGFLICREKLLDKSLGVWTDSKVLRGCGERAEC